MAPLVSIIIVNYNAGDLLITAVKNIIGMKDVEVVVADNNSSDGSFVKLGKLVKNKNLVLIDNGANLGFGKAVNAAVKKSSGEYVYLLNPDAAITEKSLKRMIKTALDFGDNCIVAPRLENPDGTAQPSCYHKQSFWNALREYWLGIEGAYSKYLPTGKSPTKVYAAVAAAWLMSRNTWEKLGGLNDKFFLYFEDIDMCDRAHAAGVGIVYDPQAVVKHHHGVSSRTNPIVMKLFVDSAYKYHGVLKKYLIDFLILSRNLVTGPYSFKKLAILLVGWVGLVFSFAALGYFFLPARYAPLEFISNFYKSNFLLWSWANFDGEHYLSIARQGYEVIRGQSEYAFFPLLSLLIAGLSRLGFDLYTSAHLIVTASLIGLGIYLSKWVAKFNLAPLSILALLLLSPGAVFLLSIYTEPLFLMLVSATFFYTEEKKWGRAAIFSALATATRINGIFVALYLIIRMYKEKENILKLFSHFVLSLSGLGAYLYYLYMTTGDALAFYHAQAGWGKDKATSLFTTVVNYATALTSGWVSDLTHLVVLIEVVVTLLMIYLVYKLWRSKKIDISYKLYALGNLALPLATGSLGSMPRFSLTLFPVLLIFPSLSLKMKKLIILIFLLTSTTGIILFTRGYWYA